MESKKDIENEATCAGSLKASWLYPASADHPASSPEEVCLSELKDAVDAASKRGKAKGSKRKDEAHHGPFPMAHHGPPGQPRDPRVHAEEQVASDKYV